MVKVKLFLGWRKTVDADAARNVLWEGVGVTTPQIIADHINATGITTPKGRRWTGLTAAKFLSSPGAKRYRSGGISGVGVETER